MQKPRFLIVVPKFAEKGKSYQFPLGLAYISSALKSANYHVDVLNLNHHDSDQIDILRQTIERCAPTVFATGALSPHFNMIKQLFDQARTVNPNMIHIVGNGVFSGDPDNAAKLLDIDIGVMGEGEETIVEIADALSGLRNMEEVQGIVIKRAGQALLRTPARKANKELDKLAWPDYDGFEFDKLIVTQKPLDDYFFHSHDEPRCISMVSSRSCPYSCTFCFHPTGRVYRERSLDNFFAELDYVIEKYRINMVAILDELFAVKKDRLAAFCQRIKSYNISWMVQLHVSIVDADILKQMKEAGCTYVSLGLESMDADVLKSMAKKATPEMIENALQLVYDHQIGIQGNFIFGDFVETLETAENTVDWWAQHRHYQISLSILQSYQGTPIYQRALRENLLPRDRAGNLLDPSSDAVVLANLSKIDESDLLQMRRRLLMFTQTLVMPATVHRFEQVASVQGSAEPLYEIDWQCPRCEHENQFRNFSLDSEYDIYFYRLSCRNCYSRFDVENLALPIWDEPDLEGKYRLALKLSEQNQIVQAEKILDEILSVPFPPNQMLRPEPFVQAAILAGYIRLKMNDPRLAAGHFLAAVRRRPFDPYLNLSFATALFMEGSDGAARLYARQAMMVNRGRVAEIDAKARSLLLLIEQHKTGKTSQYFLRHGATSDVGGPQMRLRQA